jgi:hypothetical protein
VIGLPAHSHSLLCNIRIAAALQRVHVHSMRRPCNTAGASWCRP